MESQRVRHDLVTEQQQNRTSFWGHTLPRNTQPEGIRIRLQTYLLLQKCCFPKSPTHLTLLMTLVIRTIDLVYCLGQNMIQP